jgi:peptidyl-tRNA hydrolase
MVIDALAERWRIGVGGRRHEAELGTARSGAGWSWRASDLHERERRVRHQIAPALSFGPPDILAIYDDLDLPSGRFACAATAGGGHNRVASLISVLGKGFPRLRVGIGRPPAGGPVGFVLERFAESEITTVRDAIVRAADGVESWLTNGLEPTMNVLNRSAPARS